MVRVSVKVIGLGFVIRVGVRVRVRVVCWV